MSSTDLFIVYKCLYVCFRVDNKNLKNEINKEMSNIGNDAKGFIQRLLGDVSKKSATKQILIGTSTGW